MNLQPLRALTPHGLEYMRQLVALMREDGDFRFDEVANCVLDPTLTTVVSKHIKVDFDQTFDTKLDLIDYFNGLFDANFYEEHKENVPLWSWLAFVYHRQFAHSRGKNSGAEYCWILG